MVGTGLLEGVVVAFGEGESVTQVIEGVGSAQGLVDTSSVRLRPRLRGCHRAQALSP
jgi:hypothetical protein